MAPEWGHCHMGPRMSSSSGGAQDIFDAAAGVAPILLKQRRSRDSVFVPTSLPDAMRDVSTEAI